METFKIIKIDSECIEFSNGFKITFDHEQECCECNYADFEQLADTGVEKEEFTKPLLFEETEHGFRFGNPGKMYYVPCYSEQNGYYTDAVNIYFNGQLMLEIDAKELTGDEDDEEIENHDA